MNTDIITTLETFFSKYPSKTFKKGDVIISADEQPAGIYYVREGIIRRYYLSEEGTEVTLNLYKPHSFLPMSWVVSDIPNKHWYEALTPVKTWCAPNDAVKVFIKNEPEVVYDLLRRMYIGMDGLWDHMESLSAGNATTKLISTIVVLAKRFGKTTPEGLEISIPLSESELASLAGMSRETASRELKKIKKDHPVLFHKGILTIQNIQSLEKSLVT
jgi:CRP/FNR family transcriptional regulator